jgi:acetyl-CoA synthetase
VLRQGFEPTRETALSILRFVRKNSSPFKRVRRLEFAELPKTVSGKIRRVELRGIELQRTLEMRRPQEFWEDDFVELRRE